MGKSFVNFGLLGSLLGLIERLEECEGCKVYLEGLVGICLFGGGKGIG